MQKACAGVGMIEEIISNGATLAYIIGSSSTQNKTHFPTPPQLELQVGFVVYPAGGVIPAHRHASVSRKIEGTCEVIIVRQGRCEVDLYAENPQPVATRELCQGDVLIVISGGHGFRMKEDTVLLEVKQGPYFGATEKEPLQ